MKVLVTIDPERGEYSCACLGLGRRYFGTAAYMLDSAALYAGWRFINYIDVVDHEKPVVEVFL